MPNGIPWTEEASEQLRQLWADGLTCSQIGDRLGVSRSAIIGRARRMNLEYRALGFNRAAFEEKKRAIANGTYVPRPRQKRYPKTTTADRIKQRINREEAAIIRARDLTCEVVEFIPATAVTFAQLDRGHCRRPIGDPKKPDFVFCGAKTETIYCPIHRRIAYS